MNALSDDPEIKKILAKQEIMEYIKRIQNVCWDKCITEVDSYLTSRQESCLSNCTDRYVDAIVIGTNRINQRLSGRSHH